HRHQARVFAILFRYDGLSLATEIYFSTATPSLRTTGARRSSAGPGARPCQNLEERISAAVFGDRGRSEGRHCSGSHAGTVVEISKAAEGKGAALETGTSQHFHQSMKRREFLGNVAADTAALGLAGCVTRGTGTNLAPKRPVLMKA